MVESVTIHKGKDGTTRRLKLHNSQEATWKLARLGGYGEGGKDPDAPPPTHINVITDLGGVLTKRMVELAALPSAPGLPIPADRFAEQQTRSPLFAGQAAREAGPKAEGERPTEEKT